MIPTDPAPSAAEVKERLKLLIRWHEFRYSGLRDSDMLNDEREIPMWITAALSLIERGELERERLAKAESLLSKGEFLSVERLARAAMETDLRAQLAAATERVKQLEQDEARLNWMEQKRIDAGNVRVSWHAKGISQAAPGCDERFTHATIRDAIDAARAPSGLNASNTE